MALEYNTNLNISGQVIANSLLKSGGVSTEFLKADGSVDSNTYYHSGNIPTYDNYVSWVLKTNGVQRTTIKTGDPFDLVAGANMSISYGAGGVVTITGKNFGTVSDTVAEGNDSRILNGQTAFSWGDHAGLYEPDLGNPTTNGYVLSSTTGGVRSWIAPSSGGSIGPESLLQSLADSSSAYFINGVVDGADLATKISEAGGGVVLVRFTNDTYKILVDDFTKNNGTFAPHLGAIIHLRTTGPGGILEMKDLGYSFYNTRQAAEYITGWWEIEWTGSGPAGDLTSEPNGSMRMYSTMGNVLGVYDDATLFPSFMLKWKLFLDSATNKLYTGGPSGDAVEIGANNVEFYTDVASLPATGVVNVLYVASTENTLHEWNGSSYDVIGGGGGASTDTLQDVTTRGANSTEIITTNGFVKTGGTSTQFLKADGSVDSSNYITGIANITEIATRSYNDLQNLPTLQNITNLNEISTREYADLQNKPVLDYDKYLNWNLKTDGIQRTTISSGQTLDLIAGSDIALSYGAGGAVTINATTVHTKEDVGLGNVDNTSDVNKPISTAQQTALDGKINASEKGVANGVATLDVTGLIPPSQLPSYVDDVLEYSSLGSFPGTGELGKIYIALDNNKMYRWSGSVYVYITSGAVESVAGKNGIVTLVKGDVGLGNVDNTSDAAKPVSTAQQTALNAKAPINNPTFTGAVKAPNHGAAANAEVVNVCYGTSTTPPAAGTVTEGTLYIQYLP